MEPSNFRNAPHVRWMNKENVQKMEEAFCRVEAQFGREYNPVIGGKNAKPLGYDVILSVDPAYPLHVIGSAHAAGESEVDAAGALGEKVFASWRKVPTLKRAEMMLGVVKEIWKQFFDLIAWVAVETGKPIRESTFDLLESIDYGNLYAMKFPELFLPKDFSSRERAFAIFHERAPRGVTGAIGSFNFLALLFEKIFSSLMAGCPVLVKPAPQTIVSSWHAVKCFYDAGIDPALIAYLPGDAETGKAIVASPHVAQITFTGSYAIGQQIKVLAAKTPGNFGVKTCDCEMGGNNSIIVCPTAVEEQALQGILNSTFKNAGQLCSALQRLIIVGKRKGLLDRLCDIASSLDFGPAREGHLYGPLIDDEAFHRVSNTVTDLKACELAEPLMVRDLAIPQGYFIGPAIFAERTGELRHALHASHLVQREAFAPILFVFFAGLLEEAVQIANATPYALTAGIYTGLKKEKYYFTERIKAGMTYVNRQKGIVGADVYFEPFGGHGNSGDGRKVGEPERALFYTNEIVVSEDLELYGGMMD